jgi:hypothetical protein
MTTAVEYGTSQHKNTGLKTKWSLKGVGYGSVANI